MQIDQPRRESKLSKWVSGTLKRIADGLPRPARRAIERTRVTCPNCGFNLWRAKQFRDWRVCDNCGHHFPMTARKRIAALTDRRSFVETEKDFVVKSLAALSGEVTYTQLVQEAQRESHLHESVITGIGKVRGVRVMLVVMDFNFMGGSMGAAAGEKIARAFELAAEQKIPLVAVTASGGARIYEGMVALMQMAKTAAAAQKFHLARLPFITLLAHPTTGGVYASFANLADIIFAEPRALIGFAGPRVIEATTHVKLPADSHRAEFLLAHGMIDAIVPRTLQRATITRLLGIFAPVQSRVGADSQTLARQEAVAVRTPALTNQLNMSAASVTPKTVWQIVELARHPDRPTSLDYFARLFTDLTELRGDRLYGDDPAIVGGIAHLNGRMVVVIGEERGHGETAAQHHSGRPEPEGYRKAWRLMRLAAKWNVPLVTLVDTPGADPSYESEKRGVAMAIAQSIGAMTQLPVPTVAVIIGEGGSGGALALAVADRVLMLENAVYSVISPEGASAILYGDASHAEQVAGFLRLTAPDLLGLKIIDSIVREPAAGAHSDYDSAARSVREAIERALDELQGMTEEELKEARYKKYRAIG